MNMSGQSLSCADARHLIHLAVGDDTLPEEEELLAGHLHSCAECRAYHAGTVDVMHVLEQVRDEDSVDIPAGAVWSAISDSVKSRRRPSIVPERRTFNGAVAALCACSLMLALVTIVQSLPGASQNPAPAFVPATSVSLNQYSDQPQPKQVELVPVKREDGSVVLVDQQTGQMYVPNMLVSRNPEEDVTF